MLARGDVVASDIQEARDVQHEAERAVVFKGMARDFHDQVLPAGFGSIEDVAPQIDGLGRRVMAFERVDPVVGFDRSDDGRAHARRRENRFQQERRGGFAFRARDAHDVDALIGAPVRRARGVGHGRPDIVGDEVGNAFGMCAQIRLRRFVAEVRRRSCVQRIFQEGGLERGALAGEQRFRAYGPRVYGHPANRSIRSDEPDLHALRGDRVGKG